MFLWHIFNIMNAAIYTRVSTSSQNVKRQLLELEEKCIIKNWNVTKKISDIISGAVPYSKRKGFQELISLVQKKQFQIIVVHEISRLGRNTIDVLKCIQELNSKGVSVYIMNIDIIINSDRIDPSANLIVAVLASLATHERELMQQRIISGIKASEKVSGRRVGDIYTTEHYKEKYPVVVQLINDDYSLKTISELTGVSYRTVQRISKISKS